MRKNFEILIKGGILLTLLVSQFSCIAIPIVTALGTGALAKRVIENSTENSATTSFRCQGDLKEIREIVLEILTEHRFKIEEEKGDQKTRSVLLVKRDEESEITLLEEEEGIVKISCHPKRSVGYYVNPLSYEKKTEFAKILRIIPGALSKNEITVMD